MQIKVIVGGAALTEDNSKTIGADGYGADAWQGFQITRELTTSHLKKVGPRGRLIITPTYCMPWRVPLNNIIAVKKAVEKYGKYPINID